MELPTFAKHRTDLVWEQRGRTLYTATPEVAFTARAAWYSSRRWKITAVSKLTLPAHVTAYVSRGGGAHGYFRNASIGLAEYFGYCDAPALMPFIVGRKTIDAIAQHDDAASNSRDNVTLHIRNDSVETATRATSDDARVLDALGAIHQALADDHADLLDEWQATAARLRGTVATSWPPVLTVPRAFGSTTIALRWPPSMHSSSKASIELSADAHGAKLWSIEREWQMTPNARAIADRPFLLMGELPMLIDQLARAVARADIMSIIVRRHVTVRIARETPDPEALEAVLDLLGHICGANSEPYR